MTSAAASLTQPEATRVAPGVRSRFGEFMLVGGATVVLFPLLVAARLAFGLESSELAVSFTFFYAAYAINDPHFAVTYLLFYRDVRNRALGNAFAPRQRLRYWLAGFVAPAVMGLWAIAALANQSARGVGWLIQLMFLLVGWHYVKQGFGVLTVLSARRGVTFDATERRTILAHCYGGWAYAWASPADPGSMFEEHGLVYRSIAHPAGLETATGIFFAASTVAVAWVLYRKWRRQGSLPFTPLVGLLAAVWAWTVFSSIDPLLIYAIPALHSLQYLYFVGLLGRNRARAQEGPPRFGRPVKVSLGLLAAGALALGYLLFHALPDFFDSARALASAQSADSALGPTPYAAAFFAIVNLHHYFMDAVLWRRENPDTRFLRD